jgi:hypothetical protein
VKLVVTEAVDLSSLAQDLQTFVQKAVCQDAHVIVCQDAAETGQAYARTQIVQIVHAIMSVPKQA